jgi:hypothetical protein
VSARRKSAGSRNHSPPTYKRVDTLTDVTGKTTERVVFTEPRFFVIVFDDPRIEDGDTTAWPGNADGASRQECDAHLTSTYSENALKNLRVLYVRADTAVELRITIPPPPAAILSHHQRTSEASS